MKKLIISLILIMGVGVLPSYPQTDTITLTSSSPKGIDALYASVVGNPGNSSFYYWIVTRYPIGNSKPFGPVAVSRVPARLTATNYIDINWNSVVGAISYDLLKSTTPYLPSGVCNCALATGLTGSTYKDVGGVLANYNIVSASNATMVISLNNKDYANPTLLLNNQPFGASVSNIPTIPCPPGYVDSICVAGTVRANSFESSFPGTTAFHFLSGLIPANPVANNEFVLWLNSATNIPELLNSVGSSTPLVMADDIRLTNTRVPTRSLKLSEEVHIVEEFIQDAVSNTNGFKVGLSSYSLINLTGTGATLINTTNVAGMDGAWSLKVTNTSGNQALTERKVANNSPDIFGAPTAIAYNYETRFALKEVTNNFAEIGLKSMASFPSADFPGGIGVWCEVTNVAVAGTWSCSSRVGGVLTNATMTSNPTADNLVHTFRFEVSNTLITIYYDDVSIGSTVAIPNTNLSPAWSIKTNEVAAKELILDSWAYTKRR